MNRIFLDTKKTEICPRGYITCGGYGYVPPIWMGFWVQNSLNKDPFFGRFPYTLVGYPEIGEKYNYLGSLQIYSSFVAIKNLIPSSPSSTLGFVNFLFKCLQFSVHPVSLKGIEIVKSWPRPQNPDSGLDQGENIICCTRQLRRIRFHCIAKETMGLLTFL